MAMKFKAGPSALTPLPSSRPLIMVELTDDAPTGTSVSKTDIPLGQAYSSVKPISVVAWRKDGSPATGQITNLTLSSIGLNVSAAVGVGITVRALLECEM